VEQPRTLVVALAQRDRIHQSDRRNGQSNRIAGSCYEWSQKLIAIGPTLCGWGGQSSTLTSSHNAPACMSPVVRQRMVVRDLCLRSQMRSACGRAKSRSAHRATDFVGDAPGSKKRVQPDRCLWERMQERNGTLLGRPTIDCLSRCRTNGLFATEIPREG